MKLGSAYLATVTILAAALLGGCTKKIDQEVTQASQVACTAVAYTWVQQRGQLVEALAANPHADPKNTPDLPYVFNKEADGAILAAVTKIASLRQTDPAMEKAGNDLIALVQTKTPSFYKDCMATYGEFFRPCFAHPAQSDARKQCVSDSKSKLASEKINKHNQFLAQAQRGLASFFKKQ